MKTQIKINKEQQLYVIPCGGGYSCLGFKVCANRAMKLNIELNAGITLAHLGSKRLYNQYLALCAKVKVLNAKTGFRSTTELIPEFIGKEGKRVEVVTSYGEKSRFIIGKSTGYIPCHLEIKKSNSSGGGAVMGYPFKSVIFLS